MGNVNSKTKNKKIKGSLYDNLIFLLPLIIAAAVVPIIVFYKYIPLDDLSKRNWPTDYNVDFFSYYKSLILMISAGIALLLFLYVSCQKGIVLKKANNIYIPVALYSLLVILSTGLSKYPRISLNGFADRYEGMYVLLSYMVLLLASINFFNSEKQIKTFIITLLIFATFIGLIGAFQYFGLDLFKSDFGKQLILPLKNQNLAKGMSFEFGQYTIYSTLFNTNYVGSYMAMLLPLALVLLLMIKDKKFKIVMGALTVLMFINWLGCRSRAGYLGGVVALLVILIFMRKEIVKSIRLVAATMIGFILILLVMNMVSGGSLVSKMFSEINLNKNQPPLQQTQQAEELKPFGFKNIELTNKKFSIIGNHDTLSLEVKENQLCFIDTNGKELVINTGNQGELTFTDKRRYNGITITKDTQQNIFIMQIDDKLLNFYIDQEGFKILGQKGALITKIEDVKKFGFEGKEKLGSERGYIWSRSIPLLAKYLFVGAGPDTFIFAFPQYDIVGKLKAFDLVSKIVDKPHDLYLQVSINTGVLSLIALLALFAAYIFSCIRIYLKREYKSIHEIIGVAIFSAVSGYLFAGIFNDSLVSVAPTFWVLLGLGISCNYFLKLQDRVKPAIQQAQISTSRKNRK